MQILPADPDQLAEVASILDAAALQTDVGEIRRAIEDGDVLVAHTTSDEGDEAAAVLGALVLDGAAISAIAVRPGRRGQGIGSALVEAAAARRDRLVATFEPGVRPFWDGLGFELSAVDGTDRLRGVRD